MAKKIVGYIKIQVPAAKANPSPPIGPALGQRGLNIMQFCKEFNAATQNFEVGTPIPVLITAYSDRSFSFVMRTPPVSYFLKKAAGVEKGAATTESGGASGSISMSKLREIAQAKLNDMNCYDLESAVRQMVGSARSMGLQVTE